MKQEKTKSHQLTPLDVYVDGLDAATDGRGMQPYHDAARVMLEATPDLLNACYAALSQLTEDREEYLEQDIEQLRQAIAKATGSVE